MILLENELGDLKSNLVELTLLVRSQLENSITAFYNFDKELAKDVIKNEKRVNRAELIIDSKCENILALFSPVAIDLRFVLASIKMVAGLERIGDNAKGIAQFVIRSKDPFDKELIESFRFREMTQTTLEMLTVLSESFESNNTDMAHTLFAKDELLDDINVNANSVITKYLEGQNDPEKILQAIYFLSIIRKTERVGDYITNIAEEIIFYVQATILRHKRKSIGKQGKTKDSDPETPEE